MLKFKSQNQITNNPNETNKLARDFASCLEGGEVVCLYGDLGAGKTAFVQGMIEYFLPGKRVLSPTFIIVRRYAINHKIIKTFLHIDLYRLTNKEEIKDLEFFEYLNKSDSIIAIEWAEKLVNLLPQKRIDVRIDVLSEQRRRITIE